MEACFEFLALSDVVRWMGGKYEMLCHPLHVSLNELQSSAVLYSLTTRG